MCVGRRYAETGVRGDGNGGKVGLLVGREDRWRRVEGYAVFVYLLDGWMTSVHLCG